MKAMVNVGDINYSRNPEEFSCFGGVTPLL